MAAVGRGSGRQLVVRLPDLGAIPCYLLGEYARKHGVIPQNGGKRGFFASSWAAGGPVSFTHCPMSKAGSGGRAGHGPLSRSSSVPGAGCRVQRPGAIRGPAGVGWGGAAGKMPGGGRPAGRRTGSSYPGRGGW
ncbi:MAG: hypothetical protein ACOX8A_07475, partial [Thermacetogeniaceae bacterium]